MTVWGCDGSRSEEYQAAALIDSIMAEALRVGPLAGASVSIAERGQLVFTGSYGWADVDDAVPVTAATRFNIASVGKIIAAAAVLRLVDAGQVNLDDHVTMMLPELEGVPALEGVRLRHLLNMTSGLPDYVSADVERWEATRAPLEPAFVLDFVRSEPRVFNPGAEWMYTNTGFYLAGLVVERVTGGAWGELVTGELLPSLGLDQAGLCDDAGVVRSVGYEASDSGFVRSILDQETGIRGDGGLCLSTPDLALLPWRLGAGGVSAEALAAMTARTPLDSGVQVDYGLGIAKGRLFDEALWGHLGGTGSTVAVLAHFESSGVSIAVVVNTRQASLGALVLMGDIAEAVIRPDSVEPAADSSVDSTLIPLAGRYIGDRLRTEYSITLEEGRLVRAAPGDPASRLPLLWKTDLEFGRADWPLDRFRFHMVDGRALGFSTYYNGVFDGYYSRRE